eukprot:UN27904
MKVKSSLKKWVNLREVQNDGGFFQYKLSDRDIVPKTVPCDVFSSTVTHMKIFQEFMKKNRIFSVFSNSTNFYFTQLCTEMT